MKTEREKRKSNLEAFKEELKRLKNSFSPNAGSLSHKFRFRNQEERDRRRMQKHRDRDSKSSRYPPTSSSHSDHART